MPTTSGLRRAGLDRRPDRQGGAPLAALACVAIRVRRLRSYGVTPSPPNWRRRSTDQSGEASPRAVLAWFGNGSIPTRVPRDRARACIRVSAASAVVAGTRPAKLAKGGRSRLLHRASSRGAAARRAAGLGAAGSRVACPIRHGGLPPAQRARRLRWLPDWHERPQPSVTSTGPRGQSAPASGARFLRRRAPRRTPLASTGMVIEAVGVHDDRAGRPMEGLPAHLAPLAVHGRPRDGRPALCPNVHGQRKGESPAPPWRQTAGIPK
jgi:hypothetical protein